MSEHYDLIASRDEVRRSLDGMTDSIATFRNICTTILGTSSVLAAFLSAFQEYFGHPIPGYEGLYNIAMIAMLVLYLLLVVCCVVVIAPAKTFTPIEPSEETLSSGYFGKDEETVLRKEISNCLNAIKLNKGVLDLRNKVTLAACILLPSIVVIFMLMLWIPRN